MNTINATGGLRAALATVVLLAAGSVFNQAKAQVDVEVIINLPGIAILDYFSEITVNVDAAALSALAFTCNDGTAGDAIACDRGAVSFTAGAGSDLEGDGAITVSAGGSLANVNLLLENVWALRGIATGNITVAAASGTGATLTNGAASIVTSGATATPGSFAPPGLVNPQFGDVSMNLDLTNATLAGAYQGSGQTYTLTVTLP